MNNVFLFGKKDKFDKKKVYVVKYKLDFDEGKTASGKYSICTSTLDLAELKVLELLDKKYNLRSYENIHLDTDVEWGDGSFDENSFDYEV